MLKVANKLQRGATLVEIMVALTVFAVAMALGFPSYIQWIQNSQIRTAAESMLSGLQLARAEALKRNATTRFQLMTSLDASCAPSTTGIDWVVSVSDATAQCDVTDSSLPPNIIRLKSGLEGARNATVQASQPSIGFNGLGQVTPRVAATITIDVQNPTGGACIKNGGDMRCLQLQIMASGQVRMCDPGVTSNSDLRKC